VPSDGRPAVGRPAGARRPEVVHGRGQRTTAGRLVRAVEGRERVRAVRVVRGTRTEHGLERGARADVRGRDGGAQAQGPPVVRVHVHNHAGLVHRVSHVYRPAVADHRHDQHGRANRLVRGRRASGEYTAVQHGCLIVVLIIPTYFVYDHDREIVYFYINSKHCVYQIQLKSDLTKLDRDARNTKIFRSK